MGIQIEAKDGYAMIFSAAQGTLGDFIAYDPATSDEPSRSIVSLPDRQNTRRGAGPLALARPAARQ
jgi:hypothetical protein